MRRLLVGILGASIVYSAAAQTSPTAHTFDRTKGIAAFDAITPALRNPRCMACHSQGDYPRQGDDLHRHIMDVRRGPHGDGVAPVHCNSCHQDHNLSGAHTPPGAPDWHLPSPEDPMIWEGLTDRQLCELLTDPKRNGGRDPHGIEEHMHTPLVLWGWHPGDGRVPVALPLESFLKNVHVWTSAGAPCPAQ